jgi:pimeloyl-ACP methyl ester carboxylesterase
MKKLFVCFIAMVLSLNIYGQTEPANYAAVVARFKLYYNLNKPDSIYKVFGPEMRAALTEEQFRTSTGQLKTQLGTLDKTAFIKLIDPMANYDAVFQNGALVMSLALNKEGKIIGLGFKPAEVKQTASTIPDDPNLTETPISQKVFTGNISGTLTVPKNAPGKIPVVLIIAGSGPTDRDGNNPLGVNTNTYKMLAVALGKNGIASLRYDKRMIGKSVSTTKEKDLRFDDYSDDAIALINMLHDDARFSKVIVLGHSEGSLVGILASADEPVSGFISVSGAGERADKVMSDQLKSQPQFIQDAFKGILDSMKKGKYTDKVDPALYTIARPSVQPYLMSWCRHDPAQDIRKLKIPILIVQGANDVQVTVANAEKLKKASKEATLLIIPGMNHVLKDAPADREGNLATYKDPNLPLKPELVTGIVDFINKLK